MSLNTEVSPRAAVLSITALLLLSAGAVLGVVRMLNAAPGGTPAVPKSRPAVVRKAAPAPVKVITTQPVNGGDAYAVILTRNLFGTTTPPAPPTKPIGPASPFKPLPVTPFNPTLTKPEMPRPKLAYTGLVEVAGVTYALIESLEFQVAQYTRVGGTAFGCKVAAIGAQLVSLEYDGQTYDLLLGENKVDAPIAPPKVAAPATPPPAANATPPAANPTPAPNGPPQGNFRGRRMNGGNGATVTTTN